MRCCDSPHQVCEKHTDQLCTTAGSGAETVLHACAAARVCGCMRVHACAAAVGLRLGPAVNTLSVSLLAHDPRGHGAQITTGGTRFYFDKMISSRSSSGGLPGKRPDGKGEEGLK